MRRTITVHGAHERRVCHELGPSIEGQTIDHHFQSSVVRGKHCQIHIAHESVDSDPTSGLPANPRHRTSQTATSAFSRGCLVCSIVVCVHVQELHSERLSDISQWASNAIFCSCLFRTCTTVFPTTVLYIVRLCWRRVNTQSHHGYHVCLRAVLEHHILVILLKFHLLVHTFTRHQHEPM